MNSEDRTPTVRAILFEDWDPVGFGPLLPADEYDAYIPGIMELLENHCTVEKERFGAVQPGGKAHVAAKNLVARWAAKG